MLCQAGFYPVEDRCDPCKEIDKDCEACKENGVCTKCKGSLFPAANGTVCMNKLEHCLSDPINYAIDQDGDYYCPKCDKGYTWFKDDDEKECEECAEAIPGCEVCDFHGTCRRCEKGMFLSMDKTECIDEFVNCAVFDGEEYVAATPEDYVQRIYSNYSFQEWSCPACDYGFYWDENQWDCTAHCTNWDLEAVDCNEYGIFECTDDHWVAPDNLSCIPIDENCIEPGPSEDLTYFECYECEPYFMYDEKTHLCV